MLCSNIFATHTEINQKFLKKYLPSFSKQTKKTMKSQMFKAPFKLFFFQLQILKNKKGWGENLMSFTFSFR